MKKILLILLIGNLLYADPDGGGISKNNIMRQNALILNKIDKEEADVLKELKNINKDIKSLTNDTNQVNTSLSNSIAVFEYAKNEHSFCIKNYDEITKNLQKISQKEYWSKDTIVTRRKFYDHELEKCQKKAGNIGILMTKAKKELKKALEHIRASRGSVSNLKLRLEQIEAKQKRISETKNKLSKLKEVKDES